MQWSAETTTRRTIAPRVVIAAAITSSLVAYAAWAWSLGWLFAVSVFLPAAIAARIDLHAHRLPDRLVALAGAPVLVALAADTTASGTAATGSVVLGMLAMGGAVFVLHAASPTSIGFGDVKLASVLGAALGTWTPALGLVALAIASLVGVLEAVVRRRQSVAFGPGLVVGFAATVTFSNEFAVLVGGMSAGWQRW